LRCKWLHSELDAIERIQVLRELREGQFDVLVGVNLLREGLDLPEVSLVVIMDADKEGFLRSEKSLIQTMGRAARNVNAEVILYADTVTESMSRAVSETNRRREIQLAYNQEHGITPKTVQTAIKNSIEEEIEAHKMAQEAATGASAASDEYITVEFIQNLYDEMLEAAKLLDFERAQLLRDQIVKLEAELKKKYGDSAPPSVLGDKSVPVPLPQPKGRRKWAKSRDKPKNL
jgi:excinuclease ABC subunit B